MINLLTKEQLLLITEKAVDWNKSALGVVSNAVLSPISWLTGSIKAGIKKSQLNTLALQWGIEYVNALKAFDTNTEVKQETGIDADEKSPEDENNNNTDDSKETKITAEEKPKYLNTLNTELRHITNIKKIISGMNTWNVLNNDEPFKKIKEFITAEYTFNKDTISIVLQYIKDPKVKNFKTYFDSICIFIENIINADNATKFIISLKLTLNDKQKFKEILTTKLADFIGVETAYQIAIKYLTDLKTDAKPEDKTKTTEQPKTVDANTDKPVEPKTESLIKEAAAYKLPTNVTELLPQEDLLKFKNIPDIKTKILAKINFKRLDTIKYEAEFILNKSKDPTSKEKSADLQRVWDIGVKNVNDYFQDVIDTDAVMKKVNTKDVDEATKKAIAGQQSSLDNLQKMDITETFPVGQKFDANKLYAFDCNIIGQNNKSEHVVLLMSPTAAFTEKLDISTFFWFKLLGGYKWDEKQNKTVRFNIFNNLTSNKKIINNFEQTDSAYYIALRNLRPINKQSYVWIYSNKGKFFFNSDIIENVDTVADKIKEYKKDKFDLTLNNISNNSNLFRLKINQRFVVNDSDINAKKYPGITMNDLKSDSGFKQAKANHDKFINIIK